MSTYEMSEVGGQGVANYAILVGTEVAGKAYIWGGKTTAGFDCSGFVSYVLKTLFPNVATSLQLTASSFAASKLFENIEAKDKQAGDIIVFPAAQGMAAHIGIVLDANYWIGSQSSTGVARVKFTNPFWATRPYQIRRIKMSSPSSTQYGRALCEIKDWA